MGLEKITAKKAISQPFINHNALHDQNDVLYRFSSAIKNVKNRVIESITSPFIIATHQEKMGKLRELINPVYDKTYYKKLNYLKDNLMNSTTVTEIPLFDSKESSNDSVKDSITIAPSNQTKGSSESRSPHYDLKTSMPEKLISNTNLFGLLVTIETKLTGNHHHQGFPVDRQIINELASFRENWANKSQALLLKKESLTEVDIRTDPTELSQLCDLNAQEWAHVSYVLEALFLDMSIRIHNNELVNHNEQLTISTNLTNARSYPIEERSPSDKRPDNPPRVCNGGIDDHQFDHQGSILLSESETRCSDTDMEVQAAYASDSVSNQEHRNHSLRDNEVQFLLKNIKHLHFITRLSWIQIAHDTICQQLSADYEKEWNPAYSNSSASNVGLGVSLGLTPQVSIGIEGTTADPLSVGINVSATKQNSFALDDERYAGMMKVWSGGLTTFIQSKFFHLLDASASLEVTIGKGTYHEWDSSEHYVEHQFNQLITKHSNHAVVNQNLSRDKANQFKKNNPEQLFSGKKEITEYDNLRSIYRAQFQDIQQTFSLLLTSHAISLTAGDNRSAQELVDIKNGTPNRNGTNKGKEKKDGDNQNRFVLTLDEDTGMIAQPTFYPDTSSTPPIQLARATPLVAQPFFADVTKKSGCLSASASAALNNVVSIGGSVEISRNDSLLDAQRRTPLCDFFSNTTKMKQNPDLTYDMITKIGQQAAAIRKKMAAHQLQEKKRNEQQRIKQLPIEQERVEKRLNEQKHHDYRLTYANIEMDCQRILSDYREDRQVSKPFDQLTYLEQFNQLSYFVHLQSQLYNGLLNGDPTAKKMLPHIYSALGATNEEQFRQHVLILNASLFLSVNKDSLAAHVSPAINKRASITPDVETHSLRLKENQKADGKAVHKEKSVQQDFLNDRVADLSPNMLALESTLLKQRFFNTQSTLPDCCYFVEDVQFTIIDKEIAVQFNAALNADLATLGIRASCALRLRERAHTNELRDGYYIDVFHTVTGSLSINNRISDSIIEALNNQVSVEAAQAFQQSAFRHNMPMGLNSASSITLQTRLFCPRVFGKKSSYSYLFSQVIKQSDCQFSIGVSPSVMTPIGAVTLSPKFTRQWTKTDSAAIYYGHQSLMHFALQYEHEYHIKRIKELTDQNNALVGYTIDKKSYWNIILKEQEAVLKALFNHAKPNSSACIVEQEIDAFLRESHRREELKEAWANAIANFKEKNDLANFNLAKQCLERIFNAYYLTWKQVKITSQNYRPKPYRVAPHLVLLTNPEHRHHRLPVGRIAARQ